MNYKLERFSADMYSEAFNKAMEEVGKIYVNNKPNDRHTAIMVISKVMEYFGGGLNQSIIDSLDTEELFNYIYHLIDCLTLGFEFCNNPCEEKFNEIIDHIVKYGIWVLASFTFSGCYYTWAHRAYDILKDKVPDNLKWYFFTNMYIANGYQFPVKWVMEAVRKWRPPYYLDALQDKYKGTEEITIYRATKTPLLQVENIRSELSWSINPNIVKGYYELHRSVDGAAFIYSGNIAKKDILAVFLTDGEILQYKSVKNVRPITPLRLNELGQQYDGHSSPDKIISLLLDCLHH